MGEPAGKSTDGTREWIVVSIMGRDRPGIVASFSRVLYQNRWNIEELSQTAIHGQFAMILLASTSNGGALDDLQRACKELAADLALDIHLKKIDPEELSPFNAGPTEPFIITVCGEDRPGLVFGITEVLAERGINITNLNAKVARIGQKVEYIQLFEVDIPRELDHSLIQRKLRERGQEMGVTVDLQHREIFRAINRI